MSARRLFEIFTATLIAATLLGCGDDPPQSASGEASAPPPDIAQAVSLGAPSPQNTAPTTATPQPLDLDGIVALGDTVGKGRPRLSMPCIYGHYAERPSQHYLRLTCVTQADPVQRMRIGIYGGQDIPSRLAFLTREHVLTPHEDTTQAFEAQLEALSALHGPPESDLDSDPPSATWRGHGRVDGSPTTLELTVVPDTEVYGRKLIQTTWRHDPLVSRLQE